MVNKNFDVSALQDNAGKFILAGLTIYWVFFLHIAWNNSGGAGIDLPYNLLAWVYIFILCAFFWVIYSYNNYVFGMTDSLLFAGAILMSLPIIWSPTSATVANALPRLGGMWGGIFFWFTLRQCRFSSNQKVWFLYCLVMAGLIESILIVSEFYGGTKWLPSVLQTLTTRYGRGAFGIFQQVNVSASFLAITLSAVLLLIGMRSYKLNTRKVEILRFLFLMTSCVLVSTVLTLMNSRTGWLAGTVVVLTVYYLLVYSRFKSEGGCKSLLILLPCLGVVIGLLLMPLTVNQALEAHDRSNHQRWLTLYYTFNYAMHHLFIGYGAGTYEGLYQNYLASMPGGNPGREIMTHPHNELLYQFAEGGLIALFGTFTWGLMIYRLFRKAKTVLSLGFLICTFPVLLHSQLEYPFYYSAPHYLVLLMLLCFSESEITARKITDVRNKLSVFIQCSMLSLALYGIVISIQTYHVWQVLEKFEHYALSEPAEITGLNVPWPISLRYEQDKTLLRLFQFNHTKDIDSLHQFTAENSVWISVHAWPVLYQNQISVLGFLKDERGLNFWTDKANRMFPWDNSFKH